MPGGMHEVEVKYRVDSSRALEAALAAHGVDLSDPVLQDDQAYAPAHWDYGQSKIGVAFARLRTQDGQHLFTLKTPVVNEQSCREQETGVGDRAAMHQALLAMGYRPTIRISKRRRTGWVDALGGVSICLDEVEHAGTFVELEAVTSARSAVGQDDLDRLARSWGVPLERTRDTYDSLVRAALAVGGLDVGDAAAQP
ncbi:class IV adenylate cyclase [Actinomadura sp. SCN-SB]|uniref:class IV adenylate cyclase n=1 Tax=Actinomadura sp. SCN-SB TaxID=3373092 RepID=UPI00375075B3